MYRNFNSLFPRNTEGRLLSLIPYLELYSLEISGFVNTPLNLETIDYSQKFIGENQMDERYTKHLLFKADKQMQNCI